MCLCQIKSSEGITISKEGTFHKLKIHKVTEEYAGKYKFEADGRKTEAVIVVEGKNTFRKKISYCNQSCMSLFFFPLDSELCFTLDKSSHSCFALLNNSFSATAMLWQIHQDLTLRN